MTSSRLDIPFSSFPFPLRAFPVFLVFYDARKEKEMDREKRCPGSYPHITFSPQNFIERELKCGEKERCAETPIGFLYFLSYQPAIRNIMRKLDAGWEKKVMKTGSTIRHQAFIFLVSRLNFLSFSIEA